MNNQDVAREIQTQIQNTRAEITLRDLELLLLISTKASNANGPEGPMVSWPEKEQLERILATFNDQVSAAAETAREAARKRRGIAEGQ